MRLRIKRLYTFVLQTFLPLFAMTFCICLFIVLMQFLWKYVDDLVGKGLELHVIIELFFYAALTLVPLALPLAILLASLMVFGNLGERLELTAMKSAGVKLTTIMMPLIVTVAIVSVGDFFFQNNVLPKAQLKMWTLLYSMRQKSPELDIPEGAFYEEIEGYNIFVERKDRETGMLHNVMIYDVSRRGGSANVIVADSGRLETTADKSHLHLTLYQGDTFEDMKGQNVAQGQVPYRRESFTRKEFLIAFDANFNRLDDDAMKHNYVGKNIAELSHTIDSVSRQVDSLGQTYSRSLLAQPFYGIQREKRTVKNGKAEVTKVQPIRLDKPVDIDSLFNAGSQGQRRAIISRATDKANQIRQDYEFKGLTINDYNDNIRRHGVELQKKFTMALACLVFFFIGAPLGSIIKKGGLAVPIVISVMMFVVYYIIDNTGQRLAKDGTWAVWAGVWLSTAVLAPLGGFLTYKANNDSAVFNSDTYRNFLFRLIGKAEKRHIEVKEIVMDDMVPAEGIAKLTELRAAITAFLARYPKRQSYADYWLHSFDRQAINSLYDQTEDTVAYLQNSRDGVLIHKLGAMPIIRKLLLYHPTNYPAVAWAAMILFPIGLTGYFMGLFHQRSLKRDLIKVSATAQELIALLNKDNNTDTETEPTDNDTTDKIE